MSEYDRIKKMLTKKKFNFLDFSYETKFLSADDLSKMNGYSIPKKHIDFLLSYKKDGKNFDMTKTDYYTKGGWSKFPDKLDFVANRFLGLYDGMKKDGWDKSSYITVLDNKDGTYRRLDGSHRTACIFAIDGMIGQVNIVTLKD